MRSVARPDVPAIDHVLSFALEHPWAVTPAMRQTVANILARRLVSRDAAPDVAALVPRDNLPKPKRGTAAVIPSGGKAFGERFEDTIVRIQPTRIISFGIDSAESRNARSVGEA